MKRVHHRYKMLRIREIHVGVRENGNQSIKYGICDKIITVFCLNDFFLKQQTENRYLSIASSRSDKLLQSPHKLISLSQNLLFVN